MEYENKLQQKIKKSKTLAGFICSLHLTFLTKQFFWDLIQNECLITVNSVIIII